MCLILVAWRVHPEYPLVVAANRDDSSASDCICGVLEGRTAVAGGAIWKRRHLDGVTRNGALRPDQLSRSCAEP